MNHNDHKACTARDYARKVDERELGSMAQIDEEQILSILSTLDDVLPEAERALLDQRLARKKAALRDGALAAWLLLVLRGLKAFTTGGCALIGTGLLALRRGLSVWRVAAGLLVAYGCLVSCRLAAAENDQRVLDRENGSLLFALMTPGDSVVREHILATNPYLVAYQYFKTGQYPAAKVEFEKLIDDHRYVAQDHYLLAVIADRQDFGGGTDYSGAWDHVQAAIEYDPEYAAPYYFRAILRMRALPAAVPDEVYADLRTATLHDLATCRNITVGEDVMTEWARIAAEPRFLELQRACNERHHIDQ